MILRAIPVLLCLFSLVLSSCSSFIDDPFGKPVYLRGEMTWWEALPQYQLQPVDPGVWMARAHLKADGNAYRFKFADKHWQCGTNFGFAATSGTIRVDGDPVVLGGCYRFNDMVLVPEVSGMYEFYLDIRGEHPVAYVKSRH